MEEINKQINKIQKEIEEIGEELAIVSGIIKDFPDAREWDTAREKILSNESNEMWEKRKQYLKSPLDQLMKDRDYFREKENRLLEKENHLRNEKNLLLQKEIQQNKYPTENENITGKKRKPDESDLIDDSYANISLVVSRIDYRASSLMKNDALSALWCPMHVSNFRFLQNNLIDKLYDYRESHLNDNDNFECLPELMKYIKFPISFNIPTSSETKIIIPNLHHSIYSFIEARINQTCKVQKLTEANSMNFYFASVRSETEEALISIINNIELPMVGSEAKGADSDIYGTEAQGVQSGSDILFHQVKMLGIPAKDAIVPIILISGQCIQIGAVYAMTVSDDSDDFYPVPILLTRALNMNNVNDEIFELIPWLKAIADHCNNLINYARANQLREPSQKIESEESNIVKLNCSKLFLKPIQSFISDDPQYFLFARNLLLLKDPHAREFALFPIGIIAAPSPNCHQELYDTLQKVIQKKRWRAPRTLSNHNFALCPGHPIFVYPNLETNNSGWTPVIDKNEKIADIIKQDKETFYSLLEEACESFERAGVCHLDLRLTNIYFLVENENKMRIKVVDWDYSNLLNHKNESGFEDFCQQSVSFPKILKIANRDWHQYMLKNLRISLNNP